MPPKVLSDGLQSGEGALPPFERLYDQYHVQVYRYLYAHLKHEHDAADLMQQVFFQAWKQRQTYEPGRGSVATWLLSIAHHRLVDFYRVSRPTISWESVPEMATMDEDPEEKVISEETMALVRKVLETLSQQEQELLALRFAARLSSGEIAAIVGKSEAATKKQLTRLLRRLQELYRRQELETPIPGLWEPVLPALVVALRQTYAVPVLGVHLDDVRQHLLERVRSVLS